MRIEGSAQQPTHTHKAALNGHGIRYAFCVNVSASWFKNLINNAKANENGAAAKENGLRRQKGMASKPSGVPVPTANGIGTPFSCAPMQI